MLFEGDDKAPRRLPLDKLCCGKLNFGYIKLSIQPSKFKVYVGSETEETDGRNAHLRVRMHVRTGDVLFKSFLPRMQDEPL